MVISNMRLTQLRQLDLNLLVVFAALAEERSVSRAASRVFLSQPAVSRALGRLRDMFHDELLVRTSAGYELTPRGDRLLQELTQTFPRLDRLLAGATFDPASEEAAFRIAVSENGSHALCPPLCNAIRPFASRVTVQFVAWHAEVFEMLERGRLDLSVQADDGHTPDALLREVLYEEEFVCVMARTGKRPRRRLTLKEYVGGSHINVGFQTGNASLPDQRLTALGLSRRCIVEVPYFSAAIRCVAGTDLIATVPRQVAQIARDTPSLAVVDAPRELSGFKYLMVWHPRVNADSAHQWLRSIVRAATKQLDDR